MSTKSVPIDTDRSCTDGVWVTFDSLDGVRGGVCCIM
jgi:hypothetical protein